MLTFLKIYCVLFPLFKNVLVFWTIGVVIVIPSEFFEPLTLNE